MAFDPSKNILRTNVGDPVPQIWNDAARAWKAYEGNVSGSLPAGTNTVGKVGIDQTTPGTTNAVTLTGSKVEEIIQNQQILIKQNVSRDIFGATWTKVSSPTLTRTDKAFGLVANAGVDFASVTNDFDSRPIWGEMEEVTDILGNVFIRIPKFYIRKLDGTSFRGWQISKHRHPGFYLPWCFWDFTNRKELPHVDVGKNKATKDGSNKLESKPNLYPLVLDHIVNFRTFARNNNAGGLLGYQLLDIHVVDVLQTLFYIEFATLNSQTIMQGYSTGQYSTTHTATVAETAVNRIIVANAHADLYRVGQAISVGTTLGGNQIFYGRNITAIAVYDASNKAISFDGAAVNIAVGNTLYNTGWKNGFSSAIAATSGSIVSNSDGKYPCVYRGIESPFGCIHQFVDGVNINDRQAWVTPNAENYASDVFASPYLQLGYVNGSTEGYVTAMGYDANYPYAAFPTAVGGGGSTVFYSDYYYQTTGQRVALFGGGWFEGVSTGLSYWNLRYATSATAHVTFSGRLVRKAVTVA